MAHLLKRSSASLAVALILLGSGATPAKAEVWTNAAGHAISANLVEVKGHVARLELPDGSRLDLPLASLSAADRQRALRKAGRIEPADRICVEFEHFGRTVKRLAELHSESRLSSERYADLAGTALERFRAVCLRQKIPEDETNRLIVAATGS